MGTVLADDARSELNADLKRLFASDPHAMSDPFPLWNRLRAQAPVHYFSDAHLVSGNKMVKALIDDPRAGHNAARYGNRARQARARLSPEDRIAFDEVSAFEAMYMSRNDGEVHDRLRRIAQRTFTPRRITQIGERITEVSNSLLDALPREPHVDMMTFAYRLPLIIIGDMLGIPHDDLNMVHEWSSKLGRNRGGHDPEALREAHGAMREFRAYIEQMIDELRSRPRDPDAISLLGDLLDASQGEVLSEQELTAMFVVLLFAGHETTTNLIGSGLLALLQQNQWERLRDNPELIGSAIEEVLRFVSPVQWTARVVNAPIEIEERSFQEGETVMLMLAAANRDPAVHADPDVLDIGRKGSRNHLAFGMGSHFCLGSPLARMEGQTAFQTLIRRFPDLKLAERPYGWRGNAMLRSLDTLPIELGPERRG